MNDKKIITKADIAKVLPISTDHSRLNAFIYITQEHDLRPILGDALYYDFIKKFDSATDSYYQKYQDLLNGVDYNHNGINIHFEGLKPILSYFVIARLRSNNIEDTRFGHVFKDNEQSTRPDYRDTQRTIDELKSLAIASKERLEQFLNINHNNYPLWHHIQGKEEMETTGVKYFSL